MQQGERLPQAGGVLGVVRVAFLLLVAERGLQQLDVPLSRGGGAVLRRPARLVLLRRPAATGQRQRARAGEQRAAVDAYHQTVESRFSISSTGSV